MTKWSIPQKRYTYFYRVYCLFELNLYELICIANDINYFINRLKKAYEIRRVAMIFVITFFMNKATKLFRNIKRFQKKIKRLHKKHLKHSRTLSKPLIFEFFLSNKFYNTSKVPAAYSYICIRVCSHQHKMCFSSMEKFENDDHNLKRHVNSSQISQSQNKILVY